METHPVSPWKQRQTAGYVDRYVSCISDTFKSERMQWNPQFPETHHILSLTIPTLSTAHPCRKINKALCCSQILTIWTLCASINHHDTFCCNKTNPGTQIFTVKAPNLVLVSKLTGLLQRRVNSDAVFFHGNDFGWSFTMEETCLLKQKT